jgi:hypothetical protein
VPLACGGRKSFALAKPLRLPRLIFDLRPKPLMRWQKSATSAHLLAVANLNCPSNLDNFNPGSIAL